MSPPKVTFGRRKASARRVEDAEWASVLEEDQKQQQQQQKQQKQNASEVIEISENPSTSTSSPPSTSSSSWYKGAAPAARSPPERVDKKARFVEQDMAADREIEQAAGFFSQLDEDLAEVDRLLGNDHNSDTDADEDAYVFGKGPKGKEKATDESDDNVWAAASTSQAKRLKLDESLEAELEANEALAKDQLVLVQIADLSNPKRYVPGKIVEVLSDVHSREVQYLVDQDDGPTLQVTKSKLLTENDSEFFFYPLEPDDEKPFEMLQPRLASMKSHLEGIFKGTIKSHRHTNFHLNGKARSELKNSVGLGPLSEEDFLSLPGIITEILGTQLDSIYLENVLIPEAIIMLIQQDSGVSREKAEDILCNGISTLKKEVLARRVMEIPNPAHKKPWGSVDDE